MANITVNVPDADLADLVAAYSEDWQAQVPDPAYQLTVPGPNNTTVANPQPQQLVPNPIPRPAWAKAQLSQSIAARVAVHRAKMAAAAINVTTPNITAQ